MCRSVLLRTTGMRHQPLQLDSRAILQQWILLGAIFNFNSLIFLSSSLECSWLFLFMHYYSHNSSQLTQTRTSQHTTPYERLKTDRRWRRYKWTVARLSWYIGVRYIYSLEVSRWCAKWIWILIVVFISFSLQSPGNFIKFVLAKECHRSS